MGSDIKITNQCTYSLDIEYNRTSFLKMYIIKTFIDILPFVTLASAYTTPIPPGIYPDPENCQNYYVCGEEPCELFTCSEDTLFDADLLICNYADLVDCQDRPNPYDISTTPGPTDITTQRHKTTTTSKHTTVKPIPTTTSIKPEPTKTTSKHTSINPNPTTTSHHDGGSRWPNRALGMYILLADNTEDGFHDDAEWNPKLFEYQQTGSNVLFFTFVDPKTMKIPKSFEKLAATRGSSEPGSVPKDTKIIFAIGGYEYSLRPNPWDWLTSKDKAEEMAEVVATWPDLYNCDGIDLDIESGAGDHKEAGPNMIHFLKKLRQLQPDIIVSQPTYGYPQVNAEDDVINESCKDKSKPSNWLIDSVGLMVYEGTQALQYVKNYAEAESQWEGFPIHCNTPYHMILLGCKGSASASSVDKLASETLKQDMLGIMVWYASVENGFQYEESWDASTNEQSKQAYIDAMKKLNS